jgi:hypothetical protein
MYNTRISSNYTYYVENEHTFYKITTHEPDKILNGYHNQHFVETQSPIDHLDKLVSSVTFKDVKDGVASI